MKQAGFRACVCGHFGGNTENLNGQTVKTKELTRALQEAIGADCITQVDTGGGRRNKLRMPIRLIGALRTSANIIILPAQNGVRVIPLLLSVGNRFFKRKLHYVVIGGWLPEFLQGRKWLEKVLKRFDGIYVETTVMKNALQSMGFENVLLLPNFKNIKIQPLEQVQMLAEEPYRLCMFSRVMKEKGIEDAVEAVVNINSGLGRTAYTLDIYGQIEPPYAERFQALSETFPPYVKYCGKVAYAKSVNVLKDYHLLLFPTRFYTEGIPGTIIDAYAAGLPVIASQWQSYADVIDEKETGITYEFDVIQGLQAVLEQILENPEAINHMKKKCLTKADSFMPSSAVQILIQNLQ